MQVYATVFCVSVLIAVMAETQSRNRYPFKLPRKLSFGAVCVASVLFLVSALRWQVGTDYANYESLFFRFAEDVEEGRLSFFEEPGLRIFAWIAMRISGDSAVMFAIAALVTVGLSVFTLWRWSPSFAFSIALYILAGSWHGSFNVVRQYVAVAIIFAGHRCLVERHFWRWCAIVIIASLFHLSALIAIFLYLVPVRRSNFKIHFLIIIIGFTGFLTMGTLIDLIGQFSEDIRWTGDNIARSINPLRVLFAFVPLVVFWLFAPKVQDENKGTWLYINSLALYAASMVAAASSVLMARFVGYIEPFMLIGLAYATLVPNKKDGALIRATLLIIFGIFFYFEITAGERLSNFQWIFDR